MSQSIPTLDAVHAKLRDLASRSLPDGRPAFLFRGERSINDTTFSALDRFYHRALDGMLPGQEELGEMMMVHDELDDITAFFMTTQSRIRGLPPKLAGAFAQHYGLPTHVFDFTASPKVAVNFAANRPKHDKPWPHHGLLAVLDVARADALDCVELFDLRTFPTAERAIRQQAFGLIYFGFLEDDRVDLKRTEITKQLGLEWLVFAHLPDDESYLYVTNNDIDLEDLIGDNATGIPQELIDLFVLDNGPILPKTAEILSTRVPSPGRSPEENRARWTDGTQR